MTQEYFIINNKNRLGPYDMVAMVRKIRNGAITSATQLQLGDSLETKPAQDWPELSEFFAEKKDDKPAASDRAGPHKSLGNVLSTGWHFLQRNQFSTVYSGLLVLAVIMVCATVIKIMPVPLHPVAFMICFVFSHFLLSCYMLAVLRLARGQPADMAYLKEKINPAVKPLILSSLLISFPAYIGIALLTSQLPLAGQVTGLFIFTVPGLYMIALYAFTPLLILDQKYDFWDAMEASRKTILKHGLEYAGVIYALFVINFLAGLLVLIPMAITLPVTMSAMAELFDETFA